MRDEDRLHADGGPRPGGGAVSDGALEPEPNPIADDAKILEVRSERIGPYLDGLAAADGVVPQMHRPGRLLGMRDS